MPIASSPNPLSAPTQEQEFQRELEKYRRLCPDVTWDFHGGLIAWGLRDGKTACSLQMMRDGNFVLQVS